MQSDKSEAIRKRAYEISKRSVRPEGRRDDHWREAEAELAAAGDRGNEGEGNKTAALAFDRNQREFAQSTDSQALAAKEALERSEGPCVDVSRRASQGAQSDEDSALGKMAPVTRSA
jgi:hypothetical protein